MGFIVGTTLAFLFLDGGLRWVVIVVLALVEVGEIALWLTLRRRRATMGTEALVGAPGRALSDLDPEGQVRVKGQIWKARSKERVGEGEDVVVLSVDGLRLEVARR
ncbi:MAG: NfeD family protein [Actinomycetota bacterium]